MERPCEGTVVGVGAPAGRRPRAQVALVLGGGKDGTFREKRRSARRSGNRPGRRADPRPRAGGLPHVLQNQGSGVPRVTASVGSALRPRTH